MRSVDLDSYLGIKCVHVLNTRLVDPVSGPYGGIRLVSDIVSVLQTPCIAQFHSGRHRLRILCRESDEKHEGLL